MNNSSIGERLKYQRKIKKDPKIAQEFETKTIDTANFAKKLMGQIVFLYFLQKKGWLGVGKDENGNFKEWGTGAKNFLPASLALTATDNTATADHVLLSMNRMSCHSQRGICLNLRKSTSCTLLVDVPITVTSA